jgi:5-methylcytosine-specific restriction endonuclease McrA
MVIKLPYIRCSFPNCHNTVGQHSKALNKNKQVCSAHRTTRKYEVDVWKLNSGCANKDSHYGFPCVCTTILDSGTLDIHHIDGNNNNRNPDNIEILCKMCHSIVTVRNGHHTRKPARSLTPILSEELFTFS